MQATNKCNADVTEDSLIGVINKMLSDNWTLLTLFIVLSGVLILLLVYFIGQLKDTLSSYYKNQKAPPPLTEESIDNEFYDIEDKNDPYVAKRYMDLTTGEFYSDVEKTYDDYNKQKKDYIKVNYKKDESDDVIDRNIMFAKYDDYEYQKKED